MKPGVEAYLASLPECKLSDKEIINLIDLLVKGYRALLAQCDFLTEEMLRRGVDGVQVDKAQKMVKSMDKRLREAEEADEGRNKYLSSTLKKMVKKGSQENYTIEGDVSNVSIVDQC